MDYFKSCTDCLHSFNSRVCFFKIYIWSKPTDSFFLCTQIFGFQRNDVIHRILNHVYLLKSWQAFLLRNGPDKNESTERQRTCWNAKKVLTFLLSVLTSDWLKQQKLTKLHKAVHIFILTFQPSSI